MLERRIQQVYRTIWPVLSALGLAVLITGCPPPPTVDEWRDDSFTFDVELAAETSRVQESQMDVLVDADAANHVYTFDAATADASGLDLTVGRILILDGIAVRRISAVRDLGQTIEVETDFVPLNEVITDGTVA